MEIEKRTIIEKASKIVEHSGTEALTISTLVLELDVGEDELSDIIAKDEDIFLMLFHELENELHDLMGEFTDKNQPPDTRLHGLFKRLYILFKVKPFYLSIIFDDRLMSRNEQIKRSLARIRHSAVIYLCKIINEGKRANAFKTKQTTKSLVESILSSFRFLMRDEQLINEMIRKLVALRLQKD